MQLAALSAAAAAAAGCGGDLRQMDDVGMIFLHRLSSLFALRPCAPSSHSINLIWGKKIEGQYRVSELHPAPKAHYC